MYVYIQILHVCYSNPIILSFIQDLMLGGNRDPCFFFKHVLLGGCGSMLPPRKFVSQIYGPESS